MTKTNFNFLADTTLQEIFDSVLPQLKEAGWEYDYVVTKHGKNDESYRFGVLLRDIPNPIFKGQKDVKSPNFSPSAYLRNQNDKQVNQSKPTQQAVSSVSKITRSNSLTSSLNGENLEKVENAKNPVVMRVSLFEEDSQISPFCQDGEKSVDDTKTLKPASQRASAGQKTHEVKQQYGGETPPTVFFDLARSDKDKISDGKLVNTVGIKSLVNRLSDIPTIADMRFDSQCVTIGIDTEFYTVENNRYILTWQFAFSDTDNRIIHEVVFFSLTGERITLAMALSWLIDKFKLNELPFVKQKPNGYLYKNTRRWAVPVSDSNNGIKTVLCDSYDEALRLCNDNDYKQRLMDSTRIRSDGKRIFHKIVTADDVGYIEKFDDYNKFSIPFTLLFHAGIADVPGFGFNDMDSDILIHLSSVSGGCVSLNAIFLYLPNLTNRWFFRPAKCDVRDTMCYSTDKHRSLSILGDAVGVPKIVLPDSVDKNRMDNFLMKDPIAFLEYAINDSVVTLCYASELWAYNTKMPVTVSSAAVRAAVPILKKFFGCDDDIDIYNRCFRGLKRMSQGLVRKSRKYGRGRDFCDYSSLVPINDDANILQTYAKNSYMGGYNGSFNIGWFDGITYDYDLCNAYATSMAACFDVDWNSERVIFREWKNEKMALFDFHTPYDILFGFFKFKFPDDVEFPCIPVFVDGSIVYPREYTGENELDGVYASGPEIFLALRLGATVTAIRAVQGIYRLNADGTPSHSLLAVAKGFINDRNLAKQTYGEGSLADSLLKLALNSIYGKIAQGIKDKNSWNAYSDYMEKIGSSEITSPVHASIITSGVRAVLLATMNQLNGMGYTVYSVTTDGLITDAPFDVLKKLDLYGFRGVFETARVAMTGNPAMWQIKHAQRALLNITTRGNVALNTVDNDPVMVDGVPYAGVCAHNGYVTGYESDSYDDRLALVKTVLSRTGRCQCNVSMFAKFREIARRTNRMDFYVTDELRNISMDFDMKRKPVPATFQLIHPVVDGVEYDICNFKTEAYRTVDEFKYYKKAALSYISNKCLLTVSDWELFLARLDETGNSVKSDDKSNMRGIRHIADIEWSKLISLVMGHRLGFWSVPYLAERHSVDEKIAYINSLNKTSKKFTLTHWQNCRRAERVSQILPKELLADLFEKANVVD